MEPQLLHAFFGCATTTEDLEILSTSVRPTCLATCPYSNSSSSRQRLPKNRISPGLDILTRWSTVKRGGPRMAAALQPLRGVRHADVAPSSLGLGTRGRPRFGRGCRGAGRPGQGDSDPGKRRSRSRCPVPKRRVTCPGVLLRDLGPRPWCAKAVSDWRASSTRLFGHALRGPVVRSLTV